MRLLSADYKVGDGGWVRLMRLWRWRHFQHKQMESKLTTAWAAHTTGMLRKWCGKTTPPPPPRKMRDVCAQMINNPHTVLGSSWGWWVLVFWLLGVPLTQTRFCTPSASLLLEMWLSSFIPRWCHFGHKQRVPNEWFGGRKLGLKMASRLSGEPRNIKGDGSWQVMYG